MICRKSWSRPAVFFEQASFKSEGALLCFKRKRYDHNTTPDKIGHAGGAMTCDFFFKTGRVSPEHIYCRIILTVPVPCLPDTLTRYMPSGKAETEISCFSPEGIVSLILHSPSIP